MSTKKMVKKKNRENKKIKKYSPDLICGVERDIVEDFFTLIKIAYPLADKANYFLELETGISGINIGITNERDFLSHLHTVLNDTSLTYEQRRDQLSTAEEHLRRAIIEPYFKATSHIIDEHISKLYAEYKEKVLSIKDSESTLTSAPSREQVDRQLAEINSARTIAREAKRRNKIDEGWTDGVELLIKSFENVRTLRSTLEDYLARAEQIRVNTNHTKLGIFHSKLGLAHIVLAVVFFLLGLIIDHSIRYLKQESKQINHSEQEAQQILTNTTATR